MKRYSEILEQNIEVINGEVYCDDGIRYSNDEIKNIKGLNRESLVAIHKIKKQFNAEVVVWERAKNVFRI